MERSGMRDIPGFPPASRAFIRATPFRNDGDGVNRLIMFGKI
jgi:hypothetical protein